jgi:opacity protein-like surface antigen
MLRLKSLSALVIGMLCLAWPVSAQNAAPTFELSAGYQFTHAPDQNLPLGFAVDGSRNWGALGLVGEIGWAHGSDDSDGFDVSSNLWHFGAGPRFSSRRSPRVSPYAQVLAGVANLRSSVEIAGTDISDSVTKFMLQPGAGVSVVAGDGWAVFGSADYRRVFLGDDGDNGDDDGDGENEFRFMIGIRMQLE